MREERGNRNRDIQRERDRERDSVRERAVISGERERHKMHDKKSAIEKV